MKKIQFYITFILLIASNILLAQGNWEPLYKITGPVFGLDKVDNQKDMLTITNDLPNGVRILRYTREIHWPEAINTAEKRNDRVVQKNLSKYTAYLIKTFNLNMFSGKEVYLLYIPKDKNDKMPEGYRPATDIFFLTLNAEYAKKSDKIDYYREDYLVTDNFNFIELNRKIEYFDFLNRLTVIKYKDRTDAQGNQIFNHYMKEDQLKGFYENVYIKESDGDCYEVSYYDAGTNAESAKITMKYMMESITGGDFNRCNYKMSKYDNPLALEAYRLISDQCPEKPFMLEFGLFENKNIDSKNKDKEGYSIMLAIKAVEDTALEYWSQRVVAASEIMKNDGNWILNTRKGSDEEIRCDFRLLDPMEVSWDVYTNYPNPVFRLYDEINEKYTALTPTTTLYENNVWQHRGSMKLPEGDYRFMENSKKNNKVYWAVCLGEIDDKAKQAELKKAQKEMDELLEKSKGSAIAQLKKENYIDILEKTFIAEADSQYVRINYANRKIQAIYTTPYYGSTVKVITGTGQVIVKESNYAEHKGLHLHGVYFETLPGNEYYIVIKNPSKKYNNSLLLYGVKK